MHYDMCVERKEDKENMNKFLKGAMIVGLSAAMVGCSSNTASDDSDSKNESLSGTITAAGSSALKPLVDVAAEQFSNENLDVSITVDAGGSGEGLKQVADKTVTLGNSDVAAEEKLDKDQAKDLVDHQVCVVAMAPIVNKDVGVKDLTKQQIIDIFTGKTTNWKDVGGPNEDIVLVTRPTSSGTRATFQKYALDGNEEALKPLVDVAAEQFSNENLDVSITVDAGGSGEGLKQVADKTVTLGNSDVAAEEKLDKDQAKDLVDHQVCVVAMAPIVNKDVGVKDLTKQQIIDIFTGKTTNWKDVGGPNEDIVLVTRPTSSGTRATFQKYALDGNEEASNTSMETDDSGVLLQNVTDTKGAIGYVALSYLVDNEDVDTIAIDGVEPTLENTYSGDYKVWTFEHMYTNGEPDKATKAFLDYIMGEKFGKKMESLGYGVSSKMEKTDH